jgi:signal transduction histidine kinase
MPPLKLLSGGKTSKQKSIEKKLLEQKKTIADMARFPEMNPGPVLRMNTEGKILLSNRAAKTVFKKSLLNKNWKKFRKEVTDNLWNQIISSGKIIPIEISVGKKCFVFHHRRDKLSGLVFAYGSDITLNKQIEKKLEEQKVTLAAMARFPDMNPGPVIRMDTKGKILLSNIAAQRLFGENITGRSWLQLFPGLTGEKWNEITHSDKIIPYEIRIDEKDFVFHHRFDFQLKLVFVYGTDLTLQKLTEKQLRQSEKMASLGEITAGIAHEIQNPLNFINNFSDVSNELLEEMKTELAKGNTEDALAIVEDVKQNLEKILHHGRRADGIVKGMLQHSRSSSGVKELVDINALCDEYLRLAFHGLRAKDKSFNAKFETDLDPGIEKINVVPQEIGRVILNLINNAFYAVSEKAKKNNPGYEPTVTLTTSAIQPPEFIPQKAGGGRIVQIKVSDNGGGIPQKILDKIFQPFFTTKPTGQGTGLGLSLSYDTVKAHGGEITVKSKDGEGSEFIIKLPIS